MKARCMWYVDQGPPKRWKCVVHGGKLPVGQHSLTLANPCRKSKKDVDPVRYAWLIERRNEQVRAFNSEARLKADGK